MDERIDRYTYLINTGWITPNEARKLMDLSPISDGDIPDAKIEIGIRDGQAFFRDSLAAVHDSPNGENNSL